MRSPGTFFVLLALLMTSCAQRVAPHAPARVDRTISESSYPVASNPSLVGTYAGLSKSGAGYFWDEVLEYRVWMHPENGAEPLAGDDDYFAAFATYEKALQFSEQNAGAEAPLVLVRQNEHVNEPKPGEFEWIKEERVTEWQPQWLDGTRRGPNSIPEFLKSKKSSL